ncbi:MAG: hypothetical protein AVDCRST_MAG51-80 [uncultured Ramlibacter sp.]|uniref:Uncharacterized protein n=1 Tax=uncultured Ramlibacter sp. TaxID=260755 RepID=A0A6J4NEF1_9BURK|nr:MAG: hypothetical protein AVDCRST_MAG51-80 [uncultured Ramlibacter sp.]
MNEHRKPLGRRWSDSLGPAEDRKAQWAMSQQWPLVVTTLSDESADLLKVLDTYLERPGARDQASLEEVRLAMRRLQDTARRAQQITRLAGGRIRQEREEIDLGAIVESVLRERARDIHRAGATVRSELQVLPTGVDATVAFGVVDSLLDWLLSRGRELEVRIEAIAWPPTSRLVARAIGGTAGAGRPARSDRRRRHDGLRLALLRQLVASAGLEMRMDEAADVTVCIEFPMAFDVRDGLAKFEIAAEVITPSPLTWVLVVATDPQLLSNALDTLSTAGFEAKGACSPRQAWRLLEQGRPGGVVLSDDARGGAFDTLRAELLAPDGPRPLIEVTRLRPPRGMQAFRTPGIPSIAREDVARELAPTLLFQLTKAG